MSSTDTQRARSPRIVIVGGGASGLLTARALLADGRPADVTIVEPRADLGAGLAYGTRVRTHRLNVPASRMSALPDESDDFLRWLRVRSANAGSEAFVARGVNAEYLAESLEGARASATHACLRHVADEARDVESAPEWSVHRANGPALPADRIVLALGNPEPRDPLWDARVTASLGARYVFNPWNDGALTGIASNAPVLLIGSGLTAVDVVLSLRDAGHRGSIFSLSRHGLVPAAHREGGVHVRQSNTIEVAAIRGSVRRLLSALREDTRRRIERGEGDGRDAVAGLRAHTQALWRSFDDRERRRFLAHLRTMWDVLRHRLPPDVAQEIAALRREGTLTVRAGRLRGAQADPHGIEIGWVPRGAAIVEFRRGAHVINATGPDADYRVDQTPLAAALHARGWLVPDRLGLGVRTETDGALVTTDPRANERFFTLGPPRIGDLWETTAIPEIRVQAVALARRLLDLGA